MHRLAGLTVLTLLAAGCGAMDGAMMRESAPMMPMEGLAQADSTMEAEASEGDGGGGAGHSADEDGYLLDIADKDAPAKKAPGNRKRPNTGKKPAGTAVEPGRSIPLLIYKAELHLAVFQVQSTQKKILALTKEHGGFLSRQSDRALVVRVPARAFETVLDGVEGLGNVIHRNVQAQDVTEEFRDQTIRLRNFESVRAHLEKLLAKAEKVKDALEVQRELARITEQIERIKGRLRFLEDRIAFSTITINFQPKPQDDAGSAPAAFQLPFPWIQELGLRSLMDVR